MRLVLLAGAWLVTALAAGAEPCHDERPEQRGTAEALVVVSAPVAVLAAGDACCARWQAACYCCEVQPAPLAPVRTRTEAPASTLWHVAEATVRPLRDDRAGGATSERGPPDVGFREEQGPRGPPANARA